MPLLIVCLHISLVLAPIALAQQNFVVPWNTTKFGPDGPWQAVDITVGGNDSKVYVSAQNTSKVAVYPGGEWESITFSAAACVSLPDSLCGAGGFWEPDIDDASRQPISLRSNSFDNTSGIQWEDARRLTLGITIGSKTVWNATLANAHSGNVTYPNKKVGGVPLGHLSLGAPDTKQFFSMSPTIKDDGIDGWLFAGRLYEDGDIPSYSYGLHIGSAAFDYPGSLVFGGYNRGRVIGPVTSFSDQSAVDLIDIGIGVEFGGSPFNFTSKDKLLSGGQTKVTPNPLSPYLSLPRETCQNLAALLPVTFDQALRYYVWNTNDERYTKIVSSPTYISFTFPPSPGATENVVIKVPFALLNLTLDKPITDSPTQYFPCMPYDDGRPVLGRAFLQAAFLGRNWKTKTSWLAQAPGPGVSRLGLGDQNIDIPTGATTIEAFTGANLFNQSWSGHWSIIASQATPKPIDHKPTDTEFHPGGLSTGAKAGIGVGAAVGVISVLGGLVFLWRKRTTKNRAAELSASTSGQTTPHIPPKWNIHGHQNDQDEWASDKRISEMPGDYAIQPSPIEIPDSNNPNMR